MYKCKFIFVQSLQLFIVSLEFLTWHLHSCLKNHILSCDCELKNPKIDFLREYNSTEKGSNVYCCRLIGPILISRQLAYLCLYVPVAYMRTERLILW